MKPKPSKLTISLRLPALAALALFCASSAGATPVITGTNVVESFDGGLTIQVQGSGFGSKQQAAPVLLDRVEKAYENGIENAFHSSITAGEFLLDTELKASAVWTATSDYGIYVTGDRPPRHIGSEKHYYFQGANKHFGNPAAYGGASGWDTPEDNNQLYVAWWYKPKYTPSLYWRISPLEYDGKFIPGETLDVGGITTATFVGHDDQDQFNLVFDTYAPKTTQLKGVVVRGRESNATTIFPSEHKGGKDIGYEPPGAQKYIRIWEDPHGREGIRFSWTQMHQTLMSTDGSTALTNWDSQDLNGGRWHLLELAMDTKKGSVDLFVNSNHLTKFEFSPDIEMEGASPTIALMGLNGKVGKLQEGEIDDIYMDSTIQRVVLADAPSYEEVSHWEIQKPVKWGPESLEFSVYEGALESYENSYIYVFDENGDVNMAGFPVCSDCKAPPSSVHLDIISK